MTVWHLLVILCLVILYLAVVVVFLQVRHLREELDASVSARSGRDPLPPLFDVPDTQSGRSAAADVSGERLEALIASVDALRSGLQDLKGLSAIEGRLLAACASMPEHLQPEFDRMLEEMHAMLDSTPRDALAVPAPGIAGTARKNSGAGVDAAYDTARVLLLNNVSDEQVMAQTGCSAEEVNLLKLRLSALQGTRELPKPETI